MRTKAFVLFTLPALLCLPRPGASQVQVGPYLAFHDDADLGIGAFVGVPLEDV